MYECLAVTEEHSKKEEREDLAGKAGETTGSDAGEDREEMEDEEEEETEEDRGSGKSSKSQMKIWIAIAIGVVVALLLVFKPGGNAQTTGAASVGSTVNGDLTLVTADRNELECAAANSVQTYQCGFVDDKQARTIDEKVKLRPYMTVDRQLYLIAGLFLEPAVQQRFNTEPPNKPRSELKRFTAKCKIKIVGELDGVKLRWQTDGAWEAPKKFPVATVSGCAIEG